MKIESRGSIIDSSAFLALVYNEDTLKNTEKYFHNSYMSVVNASECLIVLTRNGMPLDVAKNLLESLIGKFLPCEYHDAEFISQTKKDNSHLGLSLGDCVCLALGKKLNLQIVTADREWTKAVGSSKIICLR